MWMLLLAFCFPVSIALASLTYFPLIVFYFLGARWTFPIWTPSWGKLETAFAIFWGVSLMAALTGLDPWHSHVRLEKDLYFVLVIVLGAYLARDSSESPNLLRAMMWGGLLTAVVGLLQYILKIDQTEYSHRQLVNIPSFMSHWPHGLLKHLSLNDGRATGLRSHPLTFAETLLFPIAYMLSQLAILEIRSWSRWAWTTGFLVLALIFSQSRGPWIAFGIMILVLGSLEPRKYVIKRLTVLLVLPLSLILLMPALRHRATSIKDTGYSPNAERLQMWKAGWHILRDHPLLGVGPGNVPIASPIYQSPEQQLLFGPWGHLHNTYITIAAERGLVGLIAFLSFIGVLGSHLFRSYRSTPKEDGNNRVALLTALLGLSGWLVSGMTQASYNDSSVLMVFYLVMGIAVASAARLAKTPG
jgi:O-antigen ligase